MTTDPSPRPDDRAAAAPDAAGPAVTRAASSETVRRVGLIVLASLVFLLPAGIGVAVGASVLAAPTPDLSPTPSADPQAASTADPGASTPAPQPAVAAVDFASPSGNLRCRIDGESAYCHQGAFVYTEPSADCAAEGVAVGVDADGAYWPCLSARPHLSATVEYDVPVVSGPFTCVINYTTGARCTHADGAGFTIEYTAGVTTF